MSKTKTRELLGGMKKNNILPDEGHSFASLKPVLYKKRTKLLSSWRDLFGIKHFQEGGGGVSLPPTTHLINLINQDEGVLCFGLLERLDGFARHGSHIGPPVTLKLGYVAKSTHTEPEKLAVEGSRY